MVVNTDYENMSLETFITEVLKVKMTDEQIHLINMFEKINYISYYNYSDFDNIKIPPKSKSSIASTRSLRRK